MCREEHTWLPFGTTALRGMQHWLEHCCTHLPCLGIGSGTAKSLPKEGPFSNVCSCPFRGAAFPHRWWGSSARLPCPTCAWEVPVPQPGQWSGESLSQASKHFCHITNALEQRGGIWFGRKEKQKKPWGQKTKHQHKAVVKIDFCLLETVSRKCHSSFMLIHSGFCLPPPANLAPPQWYAVGFQCNVSEKSNCFKKHFLAHKVLQSCHALWQSKCLNKYAKVCSSQTAFQGTKRVFSPFSADPSSSQFVHSLFLSIPVLH